ncbi:Uma2 family endonuclease [Aphanothece sacrum]|uniref:Putative restriction endonuclease domain-containing protein n=1 Tax=Aphanothece sacrum FPU1 TaxID=1920663 RepID=A0A401IH60_APHSA|nr:Uma2 family endonuclease [Aphanothece sacrum]GBF80608.1 hypothetical protein AsFPU1_2012 [Aphanothece sacrum FPU1]GBF84002.1 hypothetical protein AsFPU3_1046 [Aphanothece sacrum FPU3]
MSNLPSPLELPIPLTDDQFWQLCQQQEELQFERTAQGDLIIMTPTGGITSDRNSDINFQLRAWNRQYKLGKVFDSSGGFKLPNGADRSPDASWVKLERWNALTLEQQAKFVPLCPDFIIELRSLNDSLPKLQKKMEEYQDNGAKLGWLIDPQRKLIEVYRPDQSVEILDSPTTISGEDILPGFVLDLTEIFS